MNYRALYLSPMIPSFDLKASLRFFSEVLGFRVHMDTDSYAICDKDNLTIHLLRAGEDIGQMEFYLEVDNLEELWEGIKDKIQNLKYREPFDREYGMREIHLEVPFTKTLLFIGQEIART